MHGLEVLDTQAASIQIREFQTRMPQNSLEVQYIPASPKVTHRKGVAHGVWGLNATPVIPALAPSSRTSLPTFL